MTADPTQLEQILLNLSINARDAMPIGGSLDIATDRVTFETGTVREGVKVVPGAYARLVVSDTGHGMSADTLAHLFEPFFTTKLRGNGTGLGLATVYGIVKQSGGYIWASSAIGAGTSFELLFPESTAPSSAPFDKEPAQPDSEVEPTTVLVVDDDRAVRALVVRTLERESFTVIQASSATEAIQRFNPSVAMLVTDVVMPNMSGVTLARTLVARQPHLKVLLMSGYAADALHHYGSLPGTGEVLAKPFSPGVLLSRVLGALGRHA
jgi:CheY-like chemotaxis protein